MSWLIIPLGYFLGALPTAYIAGRWLMGQDIRQIGDGNAGAANAFRHFGAKTGIAVGLIDASKGALVILIAQIIKAPQMVILLSGMATVIGHNWSIFLGFKGGRGESTTIGILFTLITQPMLILTGPAAVVLLLSRNVILTSAFLFIPLPLLSWWLGIPAILILYSVALPSLVGFTHFLKTRHTINITS